MILSRGWHQNSRASRIFESDVHRARARSEAISNNLPDDTFAPPATDIRTALRTLIQATSTAATVAFERVTRPKAINFGDVPYGLDAVSSEWMSAVICRDEPKASVTSIARGKGSSGTSERATYHLTYNQAGSDADLPTSVFAKTTPGVLTRLANGLTGMSGNEGNFYRSLRPCLDVEAPIGYHSAWDSKSFRSIHILEDLVATKRATFCNPTTIVDRSQAEDAVRLMALYHGTLFENERLDTDYRWLMSYPQWWYAGMKHFGIRATSEKGFEKAEAVIPPEVFRQKDKVWRGFVESVDLHNRLPHTLLHGDVHLGNWYLTGENRMGLCDWQCASRGHWSRDLAYALGTMLTVEDRRAWERELVELYLDCFAANGGEAVEFGRAWDFYRGQLFGALLMWTPTYHHSIFLPDMQPEHVARELIKRLATALGDLDSLDLVAS